MIAIRIPIGGKKKVAKLKYREEQSITSACGQIQAGKKISTKLCVVTGEIQV